VIGTNSIYRLHTIYTESCIWACMMAHLPMYTILWSIHGHQLLQHVQRHRLLNHHQRLLQQDQDHPLKHSPIEHSQLWQGRAECGHFGLTGLQGLVPFEPEIGSANKPTNGFFLEKKNHQQPRQVHTLSEAHHKLAKCATRVCPAISHR
jgi:hypothetical protein